MSLTRKTLPLSEGQASQALLKRRIFLDTERCMQSLRIKTSPPAEHGYPCCWHSRGKRKHQQSFLQDRDCFFYFHRSGWISQVFQLQLARCSSINKMHGSSFTTARIACTCKPSKMHSDHLLMWKWPSPSKPSGKHLIVGSKVQTSTVVIDLDVKQGSIRPL